MWRGVNQLRERAEAKRLEAPNYISIDEAEGAITLLTGGLPFHRRTDARMLDSLLIVRGERQRSFEIGIGVNVKNPLHEAMAMLTPAPPVQEVTGPPVGPASSWLFHIDSRNILATSWLPLTEGGQVCGFRVRLLETAGRSARPQLQAFRAISSAQKVDFRGHGQGTCRVENGTVTIDMNAHEWTELEARW